MLGIFEHPVTMTPQEISKILNSSKTLKILNVYFWGNNVYFWEGNVYFWADNVYSEGFSKILGFLKFLSLLRGGVWGSVGWGGL